MTPGPVAGRRAATSAVLAAICAGVLAAVRGSQGPGPGAAGGPGTGGPAAERAAAPVPAATPAGVTGAAADAPPSGSSASGAPASSPTPRAELPRGGREIFPAHRLVGFSGGPGSEAFGRLGVGDQDQRVREIERLGVAYAAGRTPLPVLELITVVAQPRPGADGRYRSRIDPAVVEAHLALARRHRALLLLNVQPGRARFLDEVRALEGWLTQPDVGLALDPEWAVGRGQVPGRVYGRTSGAELDTIAAYLSGLVAAHDLPEKVMVVHQLRPDIVARFSALRSHPGVAVVQSVDGIGPAEAKVATWRRVVATLPPGAHPGFKLFFSEDVEGGGRLMTAFEVLSLRPQPEYVLYE